MDEATRREDSPPAVASCSDSELTAGDFALGPSTPSRPIFQPGAPVAERYNIIELLGEGGMGAVYKAHDRELDRVVALKFIRPELASNAEILQRFKQEIILAREITHRNVVRIYDVGESAEGTKFVSMEFVEGESMAVALKRRGRFPPADAAAIMHQVFEGLAAAHACHVVHRDLKPANIMCDPQGRIVIMDFGLARHESADGMTRTGAVLGTVDYMSPEQAQGKPVDARCDLFTAGMILYELLTGLRPYQADSAVASLLKRTHERPQPASSSDPSIPRAISDICSKCLEINPEDRYQSATELLADLDAWMTGSKASSSRRALSRTVRAVARRRMPWRAAAISAVVVAVAAVAGIFFLRPRPASTAAHTPISVLVADFTNHTGDPVFDGTLEPAFTIAMEGAPFISSYNRGQAHKLATKLQPGSNTLDETLARLIAIREGISTVISGSIVREGESYRVAVRALEGITGKIIVTDSEVVQRQDVLVAMGKLAASLRKALGDATPESVQLSAAETYSARSLDAAHEYALAQIGQFGGDYDGAIQHSQQALQYDPELGRAYAVMAVVYNNMKQPQQAEKYFQLALSKIDTMSDREKYRTRAAYYLVARKPDMALEELQQLVSRYPADNTGIANLALAHFYRRDMVRALAEGRLAVQIYPKNTIQQNNVGLYAMYAGEFEAAIQEQRTVLKMNPSFVLGYVGTALPQLALGRLEEASATYGQLARLGGDGASAAAVGLADIALYQGRLADAIQILQTGASNDWANKNPDGAAAKLATLAQAQLLAGSSAEAARAADRALAANREVPTEFWAARAFVGASQEAKALALAHDLSGRLEADPQAYGKIIEGEIQLKHGKPQEALKLFLAARKLADTWMGRFDAGRAYIDAGAFAEGYSELEICQKRRGEATALFLDESPTYYLFPPVYYYLGRAQQGLKSPAASASYQTFVTIKTGGQDPLLADARRRLTGQ